MPFRSVLAKENLSQISIIILATALLKQEQKVVPVPPPFFLARNFQIAQLQFCILQDVIPIAEGVQVGQIFLDGVDYGRFLIGADENVLGFQHLRAKFDTLSKKIVVRCLRSLFVKHHH